MILQFFVKTFCTFLLWISFFHRQAADQRSPGQSGRSLSATWSPPGTFTCSLSNFVSWRPKMKVCCETLSCRKTRLIPCKQLRLMTQQVFMIAPVTDSQLQQKHASALSCRNICSSFRTRRFVSWLRKERDRTTEGGSSRGEARFQGIVPVIPHIPPLFELICSFLCFGVSVETSHTQQITRIRGEAAERLLIRSGGGRVTETASAQTGRRKVQRVCLSGVLGAAVVGWRCLLCMTNLRLFVSLSPCLLFSLSL